MAVRPPRLTIELVPASAWLANVRAVVTPQTWGRLREQVGTAADWRCEICAGRGRHHPIECHEVWHYDDNNYIQRLVRLIALCPACHRVKHIGLTTKRGGGDAALHHLQTVNNWSDEVTVAYVDLAFETWRSRSRFSWTLDLEALAQYGIDPTWLRSRLDGQFGDPTNRFSKSAGPSGPIP